jgi:hypothetical protein
MGAFLYATASDGHRVYVVSPTRQLSSFDAIHPSTVDLISPIYTLMTPPALSADKVFVGATDGFYAFRR